ncbi:MAG: carbohydrate ABC transporter permease [Anaerolineae bacterium]|nr:carbohydrate ABC transporter permease [Anaerolineae bacterium]
MQSYRLTKILTNTTVYIILTVFALFMLFPFIFMFTTSLKEPQDTFRYPPRLLPREPITTFVEGFDEPLPLYYVEYEGKQQQFALAQDNIKIGVYADPNNPDVTYEREIREVRPTGGFTNQETIPIDGEEMDLFDIEVDGQVIPMIQVSQTALGRFVSVENPEVSVLQNVRLSQPVENLTAHPENYREVIELQGLDRSLINTTMVTVLVVIGQLATSVVGGYAFARLRFPGRDNIFLVYLGTLMIPFSVLIMPLYQLMVWIGWVDNMAALIVPWIFTAYGTFLMRQFFITIPREIEEAALIDGASRFQILWRIFLPASAPALATLGTFSFLYAWNSFFWPLVVINTGNVQNHVLTLSLNVLRGRASDSPNLILAGAAIAILPPLIIFILGQRFFVESVTSSGVKG